MKFLFERLDSKPTESLQQRVVQALDQVVAVQYLSDKQAPPGVLNFGVPRPVDIAGGSAAAKQYAQWVEERVLQFEPRLQEVQVAVRAGKVEITARLKGGDPESAAEVFSWKSGRRDDRQ